MAVHAYKKGGNYIVLDTNSGAVHKVSHLVYDCLLELSGIDDLKAKLENSNSPEKIACYKGLLELYNNGLLWSADPFDTLDKDKKAQLTPTSPLKAMCFHISHDCNLFCKYCFAEGGDFGGKKEIMSLETAKKGIDFFLENSSDRQTLELDFFGGEPLLGWNTIVETVKYAREKELNFTNKEFLFTITTNGVLLDDFKIDFINKEISNVVLSLDGRKAINDFHRPTINGKGSYDLILPKFKKLVDSRKIPGRTDYYIRGTFTKKNLDFVEDILHIASLGFKNISMEPVTLDPKEFPELAITENDLPLIIKEYNRLFEIIKAGVDWNFFHFNIDLEGGPCIIKRIRGCGAGNDYMALTPDRKVYPCHRFVSLPEHKMADIGENFIIDDKKRASFSAVNIYSKSECTDCWAKFYCSGGCNATSYAFNKDVNSPDKISCELMKARLECAIALQV